MASDKQMLVSVTGVSIGFSGRNVLKDINLSVHSGEIVTLIGPNGAGKSTLVRVVLGLVRPDSGSVSRRERLRIGYMPQRLALDHNLPMTVRRFLTMSGVGGSSLERVSEEVGIGHLLSSPMQSLSGGENQRVLLAKALLRQPELLVLDEPVQGIDVAGQSELYNLIGKIRDHFNCGVLMVSHDLHLVMASTDNVLCLNGHLCCTGHPEDISRHPAYLELFGKDIEPNLAVYTHQHDHEHNLHGDVVPIHQENRHG